MADAPAPGEARRRLLDGAVAYLIEHGTAELSLRRLAGALGTSHRMLLYHFGSKENLLVQVVRAIDARNRQVFADILLRPGADPGAAMREMYRFFARPEHWPYLRLYFELYGRGLRGDPIARRLIDGDTDAWLEPLTEFIRARGVPEATARADARIAVAATRGLALDLVSTGDVAAVDEASERFIATLEHRWSTDT